MSSTRRQSCASTSPDRPYVQLRAEQLRKQPPILSAVVEHRRAVTLNPPILPNGAPGARTPLAGGQFSRQHDLDSERQPGHSKRRLDGCRPSLSLTTTPPRVFPAASL